LKIKTQLVRHRCLVAKKHESSKLKKDVVGENVYRTGEMIIFFSEYNN
jgi:hypothetical protein